LVLCEGGNASRSSTRHGRAHPKHPGPPRILLLADAAAADQVLEDGAAIKREDTKDSPDGAGASLLLQLLRVVAALEVA
jgi:hypothetical protein